MKWKYLRGSFVKECLRMEMNCVKGTSIVWKSLVRAFPWIGQQIAWKIGKGNKVQIGEDPSLGYRGNYKLFEPLSMTYTL